MSYLQGTHGFVWELLIQLLVGVAFVLHLLALLIIVDSKFLQCLQHLLHLLFGWVAVSLQSGHFILQTLKVLSAWQQQLCGMIDDEEEDERCFDRQVLIGSRTDMNQTHLILVHQLLFEALCCLTVLVDLFVLKSAATATLMLCRLKCSFKRRGATGGTHLVVQLMVEVGDQRLVLSLLFIWQRGRGRGQVVNHCCCLTAAFLVPAELLFHRYRLTWEE